jgi:hypothetical protein
VSNLEKFIALEVGWALIFLAWVGLQAQAFFCLSKLKIGLEAYKIWALVMGPKIC